MSIYQEMIKKYGEQNQIDKTIEELAELIRALARNDRKNIIEELVDVDICLNYIKEIYKITENEFKSSKALKISNIEYMLESN